MDDPVEGGRTITKLVVFEIPTVAMIAATFVGRVYRRGIVDTRASQSVARPISLESRDVIIFSVHSKGARCSLSTPLTGETAVE